jgi:hypothetical protein
MEWNVVAVHPFAPLALRVQFADGLTGTVQFEKSHLMGVFDVLNDPAVFQQVFIDGGAVAWPGNIDLAPDAMYAAIKSQGSWVLR